MTDRYYDGFQMCQLSLPGFDGSADAFLGLVAQRKVELAQVPVADVAHQFLSHLTETDHFDLRLAGEYMAAAARLMAQKSAFLLVQPTDAEDVEPDVAPFDDGERARFGSVAALLATSEGRESLPPFVPPISVERRAEPRPSSLLIRAWQDMHRRAETPGRRVTVPGYVRLEVAVSRLIRSLRAGSKLLFSHIVRGANRNDTVIHFMAVLELLRQRRIEVGQEELFSDISVQWKADSAASSSRVG